MPAAFALASGLLFGFGLAVSGMIDPARVLNFLDLAGSWDATLAFVMAGAVITTFAGYRLVLRRGRPIAADRFSLPTRNDIDAPLVAGAALFGLGWGLAGICPGPALAGLASLRPEPVVFVIAMAAAMALTRRIQAARAATA